METNKELQKTITKGIINAQLIGITISFVVMIILGLLIASFGGKTTQKESTQQP